MRGDVVAGSNGFHITVHIGKDPQTCDYTHDTEL